MGKKTIKSLRKEVFFMKKLRIGIIGCGWIANRHIDAYRNMEDVEVVAAADIVPGKAREFLDRFGFPEADAYETHEALCERDDIDAVFRPETDGAAVAEAAFFDHTARALIAPEMATDEKIQIFHFK